MRLPLPRRFRARRMIYLGCAIATVIATTTSAWAGPATKAATKAATKRSPATTITCGAQVLHKATGGDWTCSFDDEFSGYSLDPTQWTAMDTATSGFTAGVECYAPNNVSLNGSALVLTATRLYRPTQCGNALTTAYQSGMVTTQNLYSQAYGRFEMRAKMPVGVGMHPAFWMIPATPLSSATSYGEIDVAEAWGSYPNIVSPHLHYVSTPGNSMGGVNCSVANSAGIFHTYALEWTATQMTFVYDGQTCWSTTWTPQPPYAPVGSTMPVPFDQPYFMMVELAVDGRAVPTNAVTSRTRLPAKMIIDYIRAWK